MNTIYSQRLELNNWEIKGIDSYLYGIFNLDDSIYTDKTLHFDDFGVYKISHGDDLYITQFNDDKENVTYRLNLSTGTFTEISEDFDFIAEHENIFDL